VPAEGLNAATGEYEDLFKTGVIDAAKVTRSALQNAASIAALFLTTEAVIVDKPEETRRPCPAGDGRLLDRRHPVLVPDGAVTRLPRCCNERGARGRPPNRSYTGPAAMVFRSGARPDLYTDGVPLTPTTGWGVLHLFCRVTPDFDANALRKAVKAAEADGYQVVPVAMLGHKADLGLMALGPDLWRLRRLPDGWSGAGLESWPSPTCR
jgi:hypothetical protein